MELKTNKISVVIPTQGEPYVTTIKPVYDVCRKAGIAEPHFITGRLSAADSRSKAVKWFLDNTDNEYLIMVDQDVIPPENMLTMVNHNVDIVGGPYLIFVATLAEFPVPCVFERVKVDTGIGLFTTIQDPFERRGLIECDGIGTGLICIKREVLEKVKPAFTFELDEWGQVIIGEDLNFCLKAKAQGFKVFADYECFSEHFQRNNMLKTMTSIMKNLKSIKK